MTDYRVRIEFDDEYNRDPGGWIATGDDAADREYVAQFERGELVAYDVMIEQKCELGGWHCIDSVGGVDVDDMDALGTYDDPSTIRNDYIRQLAIEMIPC